MLHGRTNKLFIALFLKTLKCSAQWLNRGLHEVPAEALGWLRIPPNGVNVTGNIFEWFNGMESRILGNTTLSSHRQQHNRGFGLVVTLPLMNKYGCWCYRGQDYPGGRGTPVDSFDSICKHVHMAWDCLSTDATTAGESCDPSSQPYTWFLTPTNYGTVQFECQPGETWCAQRVCEIDLWFVGQYWSMTMTGTFPDFNAYQHAEDDNSFTFSATDNCPPITTTVPPSSTIPYNDNPNGQNGGGTGTGNDGTVPPVTTLDPVTTAPSTSNGGKVCCGDYPYRSWFHDAENRACCEYVDSVLTAQYQTTITVGSQYNTETQICCDTGVSSSTIC